MSDRASNLQALERKVQTRIKNIGDGLGGSNGAAEGLPFDPILAPPARPVFPRANTNVVSYKDWEKRDETPASASLRNLYNKFKGERCFIIGNGPSLNNHDLSKLEGEHVFAVNSFYYKTQETGFRPTFFVVEDDKVMEENFEHFIDYDCPYKFFPTEYQKYIPESESTYFFKMNHGYYQDGNPYFGVPRFSTNALDEVFCGQTVTYINLQLAHYLGFTQVFLIGMDFHYIIPKEHQRDGHLILSTTDDPNHFHKDYFGAGKTWKDPKLDRVAANYRLAKLSFEASGRRIYNATIGGKLEIFDRVDYSSLFPFTNQRDEEGNLVLPPVSSFGEGSYRSNIGISPVSVRSQRTPKVEKVTRADLENPAASNVSPPVKKDVARQSEVSSTAKAAKTSLTATAKTDAAATTDNTERKRQSKYAKMLDAVQVGRRMISSLWRRRLMALPILIVALIPIAIQLLWPNRLFDSVFDATLVTVVSSIGIALAYVSLRAYISFRTLSSQVNQLSDWISILERKKSHLNTDVAKLSKRVEGSAASVEEVAANLDSFASVRGIEDRVERIETNNRILSSGQNTLENRLRSLTADGVSSAQLYEDLAKVQRELRLVVEDNAATLNELSRDISVIDGGLDGVVSSAERNQHEIVSLWERAASVEATLNSVAPATEKSQRDIEALSARTSKTALEAENAVTKSGELQQELKSLEHDAASIKDQIGELNTYSVGLDIAVVARSLRTLWLGGSGIERRTRELDREHGHVLLMDMLAVIERENPGTLAGKSLIEVGMTREPYRSQRSTQKLGLFAALMDLYYIGVDIDPKNVNNAKNILAYLNPGAQAYVSKGEDFLRLHSGTIDFVYLDAYDFYHDNHSHERQEVYRTRLGSEISDEQCWKMHADCAETIIKRLSPGGVVALDDTWKSVDGEWQGKGKLAAPMFLDAGFKEMARTEQTVCFKRDEKQSG